MKNFKLLSASPYFILMILLFNISCEQHRGTLRSSKSTDKIGKTDTTIILKEESVDSTTIQQVSKIGGMGELKVTLLWNFQGDIDLHILQPNGCTIYFADPRDKSTGGYLDVDNVDGGDGSTENIYWEHPQRGQYTIFLVYYQPSVDTGVAESGMCTVIVMQKGEVAKKYEVYMGYVKERRDVATLNVQ